MSRNKIGIGVAIVLIAAVAVVLVATSGGSDSTPTGTDAAFVEEMTPHHESAIEMAKIAQRRAEHPEIKQLADDIVKSQSSEIQTLKAIQSRLGSSGGATLGLSSEEMGMSMDNSDLKTAEPFDRAFIDMMIPHHEGAILMARQELADGSDAEAKDLAGNVIAAQSKEIEEMNQWRTQWYGSPSPSGGTPDSAAATDESMPMTH